MEVPAAVVPVPPVLVVLVFRVSAALPVSAADRARVGSAKAVPAVLVKAVPVDPVKAVTVDPVRVAQAAPA